MDTERIGPGPDPMPGVLRHEAAVELVDTQTRLQAARGALRRAEQEAREQRAALEADLAQYRADRECALVQLREVQAELHQIEELQRVRHALEAEVVSLREEINAGQATLIALDDQLRDVPGVVQRRLA